ncbi:MAG TPA: sulfatase [Labilithrix sp.]|nr:sulfatase [Labilithrix sp.]
MRRSPLNDFAADLASFLAVVSVSTVALATWTTASFVQRKLRGVARVTIENDEAREGREGRAEVESADVRAATPKAASAERSTPKLNVILVTIDTLRFDLGFAGYPRPVSPNIDALAAEGVVYENAYATASFTPKCLGPLLIGRYSSETHRDYDHYTTFYPANVFLAERVRSAGGRTVGGASHRYFGWRTGFDQGMDVWDTSAIPPKSIDNDPTITSERLTNSAIELLSRARSADIPEPRSGPAKDRFFAWFHYLDPHLPYVPHEGAPSFASMPAPRVPRERALYDGEVWYTDQQIGRLLSHIRQQPWADETAIIVTADHGEAFGERGHWGHGRELWEPLVHVPLVVYVPGVAPRRIKTKRSHIDIVPTVLELMGIAEAPELHGKSLIRDLAGAPEEAEERDVYIDMPAGPYNEMRRAVITGPSPGWKLIDFGGRYELFDLHADPREARNLAYANAEQLRKAKEALVRMRASLRELPPSK